MKPDTEAKIQQDIYIYVNNIYCLEVRANPSAIFRSIIFSIPNENQGGQQQKVNTGLLRGVSDLCLVTPVNTYFIEVKTPTGVQSKFQKDFEKRVNSLGKPYFLVRSLQDVKDLIDSGAILFYPND